jgi:creatine kinase
MSEEDERELLTQNFVPQRPTDVVRMSAGLDCLWPEARGVFAAKSHKFAVWCNHEDHLCLVSKQMDGDLKEAFTRLARALFSIERSLERRGHSFAQSSRLGFVSACPTNLGTGLHASLTLRIPLLSSRPELNAICSRLSLTAVAVEGNEAGMLEVSNVERLGISEVDLVNKVIIGCAKLVCLEQLLEKGKPLPAAEEVASMPLHTLRGDESRRSIVPAEPLVSQVNGPPPLPPRDQKPELPEDDASIEKPPLPPVAGPPETQGYEDAMQPEEPVAQGLGDEECDGFPADFCPEQLPDMSKHHSIMADVLRANPSIYGRLREKQTKLGVRLSKCIKSGIDNPGHLYLKIVGAIAGDEECYEAFQELFDPVIDARHGGYGSDVLHPTDMAVEKVTKARIDPEGKYAIFVRVRSSRSLRGLRFPPACDRAERKKAEELLANAFSQLQDDQLRGSYFPLRGSTSYEKKPQGMSVEEEEELKKYHFLFQEPDSSVLLCSGIGRHWPEARGVFAADSHKMVAWLNEEDHLRLISLQKGDDVFTAFENFAKAMTSVERGLEQQGYSFAHSPHLGYISSCPSNLGTGLRASVMLRIPLLAGQSRFQQVCRNLGLHGTPMEGSPVSGSDGSEQSGIWDMANRTRLGTS